MMNQSESTQIHTMIIEDDWGLIVISVLFFSETRLVEILEKTAKKCDYKVSLRRLYEFELVLNFTCDQQQLPAEQHKYEKYVKTSENHFRESSEYVRKCEIVLFTLIIVLITLIITNNN